MELRKAARSRRPPPGRAGRPRARRPGSTPPRPREDPDGTRPHPRRRQVHPEPDPPRQAPPLRRAVRLVDPDPAGDLTEYRFLAEGGEVVCVRRIGTGAAVLLIHNRPGDGEPARLLLSAADVAELAAVAAEAEGLIFR